jgi:hypothetical protein
MGLDDLFGSAVVAEASGERPKRVRPTIPADLPEDTEATEETEGTEG